MRRIDFASLAIWKGILVLGIWYNLPGAAGEADPKGARW